MVFKVYNTLTRQKAVFEPLEGNNVRMYNCGPTVYDFAHIGNFRAYVASDILKRYLLYKGYKVTQVMNITDVDDKIIRDSQKAGITREEFTERYTKAFFEDLDTLNILRADVFPKATEHIQEMVDMIKKLLEKGIAYKWEDGSIYYNITKFKDYGNLAHLNPEDLQAGASKRVKADEYGKESVNDFALWKSWDEADGEVFWENELGKGRPGWHIECSAMSTKYLGETFDIHTGGIDLIFPHHQNEIAQSEGATGKLFTKYWLHNEYILVEGKKMSKSLGNFFTLRDLLEKGYDAKAIRYLLLSAHYRQQFNFTLQGIDAARNTLQTLFDFMDNLQYAKAEQDNKKIPELIETVKTKFEEQMDDDLNISNALASIFDFMHAVNKEEISQHDAKEIEGIMMHIDTVLGVLAGRESTELTEEQKELLDKREEARKNKDFAAADKLRNELKENGILLDDTPEGVRWKKV